MFGGGVIDDRASGEVALPSSDLIDKALFIGGVHSNW